MRGLDPAVALHQRDAVGTVHMQTARVRPPGRSSLNSAQIAYEPDGSLHESWSRTADPGVANLASTPAGHRFGTIFWALTCCRRPTLRSPPLPRSVPVRQPEPGPPARGGRASAAGDCRTRSQSGSASVTQWKSPALRVPKLVCTSIDPSGPLRRRGHRRCECRCAPLFLPGVGSSTFWEGELPDRASRRPRSGRKPSMSATISAPNRFKPPNGRVARDWPRLSEGDGSDAQAHVPSGWHRCTTRAAGPRATGGTRAPNTHRDRRMSVSADHRHWRLGQAPLESGG